MSSVLSIAAGCLLLFLAAATAAAAQYQSSDSDRVIHILLPKEGSGHDLRRGVVSCQSWRMGVETNNVRDWATIPLECETYLGRYMLGHLYREDSRVVVDAAVEYARGLNLSGNGIAAWVFDIDETTLSNLPYYAKHEFGAQIYNNTAFQAWVLEGAAPALPESLRLFRALQKLGITPIFLTGRAEDKRETTVANLKKVGYNGWAKLLLKGHNDHSSAVVYKSTQRKKLEESGYRIVGNIGDQWSDILGDPEGERTFKLPNPMYYII